MLASEAKAAAVQTKSRRIPQIQVFFLRELRDWHVRVNHDDVVLREAVGEA